MDFAQHVKSSVDIVAVIGESVRLRKQGPERWIGLCPFHSEKTPSFSVHQGMQFYKCFGCGKGGDVFNFLMELSGLSFFEALKTLAEQQGIPLPERTASDLSDAESRRREMFVRMHEIAQALFEKQFASPAGSIVRDYLAGRGVSHEMIKEFGLGFAAGGNQLRQQFTKEGISEEYYEGSGLIAKSRERSGFYDRFRDRLTFPIRNETGRIVAFGGRAVLQGQQPKYLNSPETQIYHKSSVLYNLNKARPAMRKENCAVLVEGYMDVIGTYMADCMAVVATCGTALTPPQVRILRRHVGSVVVNFDPDLAGQSAAHRSIDLLLQESLDVRVLSLPEGFDPAEFIRQKGGEEYRILLEKAPSYHVWLAERARAQFDLRTSEGRLMALELLMPAINLAPDKIRRVAQADEAAACLGIDPGLVLEQFRRAAIDRKPVKFPVSLLEGLSQSEKLLIRTLLASEEARQEMLTVSTELVLSESLTSASIFEAIAATSTDDVFQFSGVEGRLEEKDRDRLSLIMFERTGGEISLEDARKALGALRRSSWEKRYRAVRKKIEEAEKSSNREEALRLLKVKVELERERKELSHISTVSSP
ncbi:MAG: DNA primase [Chloroflexi bacterium]|nr:DNA primase [Chloroflexota bacterium]